MGATDMGRSHQATGLRHRRWGWRGLARSPGGEGRLGQEGDCGQVKDLHEPHKDRTCRQFCGFPRLCGCDSSCGRAALGAGTRSHPVGSAQRSVSYTDRRGGGAVRSLSMQVLSTSGSEM